MRAHSQVPGTRGLGDAVQPSSVPPRPSRRPVFPAQNPPGREPSGQSPGLSVPTPKLCAELDVEGGGLLRLLLLAKYRPERVLPLRDRAAVAVAPAAFAPSKSVRVRRACPGRNGRTSEAGARAGGNQTPFLSVSALSVGS